MNIVSLAIPTIILFSFAANPAEASTSKSRHSHSKHESTKTLVTAVKSKHNSRPDKHHKAQLHTASLKHKSRHSSKSRHSIELAHQEHYHVVASSSDHLKHGTASWYGSKFQGKKTANGERYDMYSFTAAHKSLPLSSYAQVTNLRNNRSVIVRINDRGPYHSSRVMDLSYAAAKELGIHSTGTGSISITPVALNQ